MALATLHHLFRGLSATEVIQMITRIVYVEK